MRFVTFATNEFRFSRKAFAHFFQRNGVLPKSSAGSGEGDFPRAIRFPARPARFRASESKLRRLAGRSWVGAAGGAVSARPVDATA